MKFRDMVRVTIGSASEYGKDHKKVTSTVSVRLNIKSLLESQSV